MIKVKSNLYEAYGVCAVLLIAGSWVYPTSKMAGGFSFLFGITGFIILLISDVTYKHKYLNAKINGYIQ